MDAASISRLTTTLPLESAKPAPTPTGPARFSEPRQGSDQHICTGRNVLELELAVRSGQGLGAEGYGGTVEEHYRSHVAERLTVGSKHLAAYLGLFRSGNASARRVMIARIRIAEMRCILSP